MLKSYAFGQDSSNELSIKRSLLRMGQEDPKLAGRLVLAMLPTALAAAKPVRFALLISDLGDYLVDHRSNSTTVTRLEPGADRTTSPDDFSISTDCATLAALAAGRSPLPAVARRRLRVRGNLRAAAALRHLTTETRLHDTRAVPDSLDPDVLHRSLPYALSPSWLEGHDFSILYKLSSATHDKDGIWSISVSNSHMTVTANANGRVPDSIVDIDSDTWTRIVDGELDPADAMRDGRVTVQGALEPVILLGRWIARATGRDQIEQQREREQRESQRPGLWGSDSPNLEAANPDPSVEHPRRQQTLLGYQDLFALWERQNWQSHKVDLTRDREQWPLIPTRSQEDMVWSIGSFYVGEERVAAELAPLVLAAPTREIELFLGTQLVDEARHAAFFDRYVAEVLGIRGGDMGERLQEMEALMLEPWLELFNLHLGEETAWLLKHPDDQDCLVRTVTVYHLVIEGMLAMTAQHQMLKYLELHEMLPGFSEGFGLVQRDEHRHVAFGVRFLKDACEADTRHRETIEQVVATVAPRGALALVPPGVEDPSQFKRYDYDSSEFYEFAYTALKRRMNVIGAAVPSYQELMPGSTPAGEALAAD